MSELELQRRKLEHSICKSPFTGFYIGPQGYIVLCCMSQEVHLEHINNVDDLELFYNDSIKMKLYRSRLEQGLYSKMRPCHTCYRMELQNLHPFKLSMEKFWHFKNFDDDWKAREEGKKVPIRYLEYTLSNICNADCATCKSEWSSKWEEIDRKFGRKVSPMVKIEDKQIAKIEKVLYGLEFLTVKGGEPFADIRNIRILKTLSEVNPDCNATIISNFHAITPEAMNIITKLTNLTFTASIDAVTPETYKWIRGGDFEKTITNMKNVYQATGRKINVSVTTSLYNYFLLDKIKDYFEDIDCVREVKFSSFAPEYYHTVGLLPESIYNEQMNKLIKAFKEYKDPHHSIYVTYEKVKQPPYVKKLELKEKEKWMKNLFFSNLHKMNEHRGFDLCDYVPELKEWRGDRLTWPNLTWPKGSLGDLK